jgi:murein DD-endopeptidase MepM/ murein hydrolase activator NlpD
MNIILIPNQGGRYNTYRFGSKFLVLISIIGIFIMTGVLSAGYYYGRFEAGMEGGPPVIISALKGELMEQRQSIDEARRTTSENIDALAMRLGRLQSHVIRLDALGDRLTKMAHLDNGEFDFTSQPAQGGPENETHEQASSVDAQSFTATLDSLTKQLENRAQQLALLETMLMNRGLQDEVVPAGRPIKSGWLSSYFGMRTDPFTGKNERHKGMDFAGKLGSDVVAVASGVITWAGRRYGYGNLVEINHGNGYSTRYGHNAKITVKVGDAVKKGQVIAKMGSTGRSTGPHVHFEVLQNGKQVDPMSYIRTSQRK